MTTEGWHAVWSAALDELELEVASVESMLHAGQPELPAQRRQPWTPPAVSGRLPADLHERAKAILDRQLRAAEELGRAMAGNRRQAAFASRLDTRVTPERPVFVDQAM